MLNWIKKQINGFVKNFKSLFSVSLKDLLPPWILGALKWYASKFMDAIYTDKAENQIYGGVASIIIGIPSSLVIIGFLFIMVGVWGIVVGFIRLVPVFNLISTYILNPFRAFLEWLYKILIEW